MLGLISNFFVFADEASDFLAWRNSNDGILTIEEAYKVITKPNPNFSWSYFPWDRDTPPSHSMTAWRLLHNKLPTYENFHTMGFSFPSLCNLCSTSCETLNHLIFLMQICKQHMEMVGRYLKSGFFLLEA